MNIGVDIDGVLTDFERYVIDYGIKISVEKNWPINIDVSQYLDINVFEWNNNQAEMFRDKYFVKYLTETPVRLFAPEIIRIMAGRKYAEAVYVVPPVAISLLLLFYCGGGFIIMLHINLTTHNVQ